MNCVCIFNNFKIVLRRPGVEPGSTAWKATMLTVTPPTLVHEKALNTQTHPYSVCTEYGSIQVMY